MTIERIKAQYGQSTECELGNVKKSLIVSPVDEINNAIRAISMAIKDRNINRICITIRELAQWLHLPIDSFDSQAQYLRSQWKASPDACIDALKAACMNYPESDIIVQSGYNAATLKQGTHFIEVVTNSRNSKRDLTIRDEKGDKTMSTSAGEQLRARVTIGAKKSVEIMCSDAQLMIFSIMHKPKQSSIKIQPGDPPHARYLDVKHDSFLAGRHFPAEMIGDPSWHELKLLPHAEQKNFEHIHPHSRLIHVTQGEGILETGTTPDCADQSFNLFPGKLIILTPGTWHRFSAKKTGLTVQPIHPVTPTSGASTNSHEMFYGTWSCLEDMFKTIQRGASHCGKS